VNRRLVPLLAFAAIAVLLYAGVRMNAGRDTSAIPSPLIGKPVPAFSLPLLNDPTRTVSNRDLLGQPYLLNVWGSWCPTCQYEQPYISELARAGKIRVIGYDYKDTPEEANRWLQQFGNPYQFILADADGQVALDWGIYGAPESFLVDADGIIRWKAIGAIDDSVIRNEIEPRLATLGRGAGK
jgi:cytochrome c biogenesis protein CcmG/thiol:disulfide interchange protein DsbE